MMARFSTFIASYIVNSLRCFAQREPLVLFEALLGFGIGSI